MQYNNFILINYLFKDFIRSTQDPIIWQINIRFCYD